MSRPLRFDRWTGLLVAGLVLAGSQQVLDAAVIKSKAQLAQVLIDRAWEASIASGETVRPWPWADTWPVARLEFPVLGVDYTVLHGASGNALAFGPGHEIGSAAPGYEGVSVIGGHRDTHFSLLGELESGDPLRLQRSDGRWLRYRIRSLEVIDSAATPLPSVGSGDGLILVTCYPLDAIRPGGSLRYLAVAVPDTNPSFPVQTQRSFTL